MVLSGRANVTVPLLARDHIPFTPTVLSSPFPKAPLTSRSPPTRSQIYDTTCSLFLSELRTFLAASISWRRPMRTEQPITAAKRPDAKQHSKFPSGRVLSKQQYECFLGIQREISTHQCPVLSVCRNATSLCFTWAWYDGECVGGGLNKQP